MQHATYLHNILPTKVLNNKSPLKCLYQKVPSYLELKVFGCLCSPLFPSTTIHKLQPRSTPCVFLGHPVSQRGYKCFDMSTNKIIMSRHVMFDETKFPFSSLHRTSSISYSFLDDAISPYVYRDEHMVPSSHPPAVFIPTNSPPVFTPLVSPSPTPPISPQSHLSMALSHLLFKFQHLQFHSLLDQLHEVDMAF